MFITNLDGAQIDIATLNLAVEDYDIPTLSIEHTTVKVPGRSAPIITESSYNGRVITVYFVWLAADRLDFDLLKDEITKLFSRLDNYYITFKDHAYKRWLVKSAQGFSMQKEVDIVGSFAMQFECINPLAESVGTSLELVNRDFDSGLWGWGSGIDSDEPYQYTFNSSNFVVHNIGTVEIDPRESFLEIDIRGNFPTGLTITNDTTGDVYQFNAAINTDDTLLLKGVRTFKNEISSFGATNKRSIRLAPGANQINITGGTVNSVVFNFKFLYK